MREEKNKKEQGHGIGQQTREGGALQTEGGSVDWEGIATSALVALATRMARRAADNLRSGRPTGKGKSWRSPVEVSRTSQDEAKQSAVLACVSELNRIYGDDWTQRAPWVPAVGPWTRQQRAFRRWLALVAWRAAYKELTALPAGVTGRRSSGVRSLFVDLDGDAHQEALRVASATFDPDASESPWFERSLALEVDRARAIRRARSIVFRQFLAPFKGKRTQTDRRAKLVAIRRARVVCSLLEGEGVGMRSDKLGAILKHLGIETSQGKRSLASALARLA